LCSRSLKARKKVSEWSPRHCVAPHMAYPTHTSACQTGWCFSAYPSRGALPPLLCYPPERGSRPPLDGDVCQRGEISLPSK
jgi:hypothetical protein